MSPAAKRPFGILRACRALRLARATVQRRKAQADGVPRIPAKRGPPRRLRSDNASEFIATKLKEFLDAAKVETLYIEPGSP